MDVLLHRSAFRTVLFQVPSSTIVFVGGFHLSSSRISVTYFCKYLGFHKRYVIVQTALNSVLDDKMAADPNVFVMCKEVGEIPI
ncbi:hypothetical protein L1987_87080 [Smallanthus sonchifolius]|nr:hypothetical protein L1987_87080 [Smallanthus sonchifolius]